MIQVINEILLISWLEGYVQGVVIIAEALNFKMAASQFVDVSEEEVHMMKENAIPKYTKDTA